MSVIDTPTNLMIDISNLTINDLSEELKYQLQKEYFKIKGRISRTGTTEKHKCGRKPKSESHKKRTRQLYVENNKEKIKFQRTNPVGGTRKGRPKKEITM